MTKFAVVLLCLVALVRPGTAAASGPSNPDPEFAPHLLLDLGEHETAGWFRIKGNIRRGHSILSVAEATGVQGYSTLMISSDIRLSELSNGEEYAVVGYSFVEAGTRDQGEEPGQAEDWTMFQTPVASQGDPVESEAEATTSGDSRQLGVKVYAPTNGSGRIGFDIVVWASGKPGLSRHAYSLWTNDPKAQITTFAKGTSGVPPLIREGDLTPLADGHIVRHNTLPQEGPVTGGMRTSVASTVDGQYSFQGSLPTHILGFGRRTTRATDGKYVQMYGAPWIPSALIVTSESGELAHAGTIVWGTVPPGKYTLSVTSHGAQIDGQGDHPAGQEAIQVGTYENFIVFGRAQIPPLD